MTAVWIYTLRLLMKTSQGKRMTVAAIEINQRLLEVHSRVLGHNNFQPVSLVGQISISSSYHFKIRGAIKSTKNFDVNKLICSPLSCTLNHQNQSPQYLHGVVTQVTQRAPTEQLEITISPWLSLLKNTCNCRIYQNKTIPDIVMGLFTELGFQDFDFSKLTQSYSEQAYVTQFNESDFNFISRCLSAAGIYYYFTYTQDKHCLVAVDSALKTPLISNVYYSENQASMGVQINSLHSKSCLAAQSMTHTDYNPTDPDNTLMAQGVVASSGQSSLLNHRKYNQYPGHYQDANDGKFLSQIKIDSMNSEGSCVIGHSDCDQLMAGVRFKIKNEDLATSYLITELSIEVNDSSGSTQSRHSTESQQYKYYRNTFKAHTLSSLPYRPPQDIPRPCLGGLLAATVMGSSDQSISINQQGCIQVQFHWEINGSAVHNTAWLRVSQQIASNKAGTFFTPRAGQEVLVSFLNGDLDRPIIIGSAYNNDHKPAYSLPRQRWVSGIKTDSGNELSLYDTPGSEQVLLNTNKDYQQTVARNYMQTIEGNNHSVIEQGDYKVSSSQGQFKVSAAKQIQMKVHNSTLTLTPEGITIQSPRINIMSGSAQAVTPGALSEQGEGEHWVQGHYINAPKNMPYSISHTDGSVFKGSLSAEGKTDKITHLTAGVAIIQFGEKKKLENKLVSQRQKLKKYLDGLVKHAQAQAVKDKKLLAKKSWWDKIYIYGKGVVDSVVHGAVTVTKSTGHLVVGMFEGAEDVLALSARIEKDALTGNQQDLAEIARQANKKTQEIIAKLKSSYKMLQSVYQDHQTRSILQNFGQAYYHSMDRLMLLKDVGNFVGGFVPAIILAVITKNPEALGAGASAEAVSLVENASIQIKEIEDTVQQLEKCATIEEAALDNTHVLGPPPEEGAQHMDQVNRLPGNKPIEMQHPAGEKYKLPARENKNFYGETSPVALKGEKIVRFYDPDDAESMPNGRYWLRLSDMPESKAEWRSHFAISSWNKDGGFVVYDIQDGELNGWLGAASSQDVEGADGWIQKGGRKQLFIPDSRNDIPLEKLEFHKSSEIWSNNNE